MVVLTLTKSHLLPILPHPCVSPQGGVVKKILPDFKSAPQICNNPLLDILPGDIGLIIKSHLILPPPCVALRGCDQENSSRFGINTPNNPSLDILHGGISLRICFKYAQSLTPNPIPLLPPTPLEYSVFPSYRPKYGYLWVVSYSFSIGYRDLVFGKKSPFWTYYMSPIS